MSTRPTFIQENVVLARYTTFKIGGCADYFAEVTNDEDLIHTHVWAEHYGLPVFILGGGSNVVFADAGYRGVIIRLCTKGIMIRKYTNKVMVTAAAGEHWDSFVAQMIESKLSGLENLSGIPGTVGASPVQNIGAYGVEVGDRIFSVRVFNPDTKIFYDLKKHECNFSYRDSFLKQSPGKSW